MAVVRWWRSLVLLGSLALLLVPSAQAKTYPTRWSEHVWYGGRVLMTFNTREISINGPNWAVTGSFKNRTRRTVAVVAKAPGIAIANRPPIQRPPYRFIRATSVQPPFPKALRPGQVWRGTFSGSGLPSNGRFLMAVFGDFAQITPDTARGWRWVTDHAIRL
jgi:hypothetical protein